MFTFSWPDGFYEKNLCLTGLDSSERHRWIYLQTSCYLRKEILGCFTLCLTDLYSTQMDLSSNCYLQKEILGCLTLCLTELDLTA